MKLIAIVSLALAAGPVLAQAPSQQQIEDACFDRVKPLVRSAQSKVVNVTTVPPREGMRKAAWQVNFEFSQSLLNGERNARCLIDPSGRIVLDDHTRYLDQQKRAKEKAQQDAQAEAQRKQKVERYSGR